MPVLNTTSPAEDIGAPKEVPEKAVPSERTSCAGCPAILKKSNSYIVLIKICVVKWIRKESLSARHRCAVSGRCDGLRPTRHPVWGLPRLLARHDGTDVGGDALSSLKVRSEVTGRPPGS